MKPIMHIIHVIHSCISGASCSQFNRCNERIYINNYIDVAISMTSLFVKILSTESLYKWTYNNCFNFTAILKLRCSRPESLKSWWLSKDSEWNIIFLSIHVFSLVTCRNLGNFYQFNHLKWLWCIDFCN